MYFPYLDNRTAERDAIKTLALKNMLGNTIPIISTNFATKNIDWADNDEVIKHIRKSFSFIETLIKCNKNFILLFDDSLTFTSLTIEKIHNIISSNFDVNEADLRNFCTYGINDFDLNKIGNNTFVSNREIAIFYNEKPEIYSTYTTKYNILVNQNFILDFVTMELENKVSITNSFISKDSNKNYPSFDKFQTYAFNYKAHRLFGFGDYTVLDPNSSSSRGGGNSNTMTVAIHITFYSEEKEAMFVAHYLCEPSEEPVFGDKVMCAVNKLRADIDRFEMTVGLLTFVNLAKATNLTKLKEYSISHHIEVMSKY